MTETQQKALERAFALKKEGKSWPEIEKALKSEEFKDSRGNPYTGGNLKAWYSKLKGKAPTTDPLPASDEAEKVDAAKASDHSDFLTREEVNTMLAEAEKRLREFIETRLEASRPEPVHSLTLAEVEEPPLPSKTGKKFAGSKADIRVRVDKNLGELFDADVNQRFGGNASRAMDAILWNYYGKPPLSFEESREPDKESDAWSVLHSTPDASYED